MRAVPELPEGFRLDAYLPITNDQEISNVRLANILRTRAFLIASMYPEQIQQKKSFWEILTLSKEKKREISASIQGTPLLEAIRKLLLTPLTPQITEETSLQPLTEENSGQTPQSDTTQIDETAGVIPDVASPVTDQSVDFEQKFLNDPIHINKYETFRELQLGDVLKFSEHLCAFTDEQRKAKKSSLKEFFFETKENRPPEWYLDELKTQAFAVIDLTRSRSDIIEIFSDWLTTQRLTSSGNAKSKAEFRSQISDNNLIEMIDLGILIGPAYQLFYSRDDLVTLLPKKGSNLDFIDVSRMQKRDIGKQINQILDIISINQFYAD